MQWGDFEYEFSYTDGGYCQKNTTGKPLISKPLPSRPNPNPPSPPGPPPSPPTEKGCCCCPQGKDHKTSACLGLLKDTVINMLKKVVNGYNPKAFVNNFTTYKFYITLI